MSHWKDSRTFYLSLSLFFLEYNERLFLVDVSSEAAAYCLALFLSGHTPEIRAKSAAIVSHP